MRNDGIAAHQRKIREALMRDDPRPVVPSLDGYAVETISRDEARPLIERYEWLGDVGRATRFVGLFSPADELQGVACFGWGPRGGHGGCKPSRSITDIIGSPAMCLERGACVHYAPPNAASFLITRACKLIWREDEVARFFAYGDPEAGEYGAVYQACGWVYLGQGLDGGRGRATRDFVLPPGADPAVASNWKTTRILRRVPARLRPPGMKPDAKGRYRMGYEQARALGWKIPRKSLDEVERGAKHVYATIVGGNSFKEREQRKEWARKVGGKPYPAPRPELKGFPRPDGRAPASDFFGLFDEKDRSGGLPAAKK